MANTPNQPAQGQQPPRGQQNQQHALTAAGVPQEHAATLAAMGVTPGHLQSAGIDAGNMGKVDWAKWIAIIQQIAAVIIPLIPKTP